MSPHYLYVCMLYSTIHSNKCPRYYTDQSDGEASVMIELWGMQSNSSVLLLPGPFWPGVVAPDWVLFMGQIELNYVITLKRIIWK